MIKYILGKYFNYKYWYTVRLKYLCNSNCKFYHDIQLGLYKKKDALNIKFIREIFFNKTDVLDSVKDTFHMGEWQVDIICYIGFLSNKRFLSNKGD